MSNDNEKIHLIKRLLLIKIPSYQLIAHVGKHLNTRH